MSSLLEIVVNPNSRQCYLRGCILDIYSAENLIQGDEAAVNIYSLQPILLFANMDVSITKMCLDTSILTKIIIGQREYIHYQSRKPQTGL
jgi:hypothetical protein